MKLNRQIIFATFLQFFALMAVVSFSARLEGAASRKQTTESQPGKKNFWDKIEEERKYSEERKRYADMYIDDLYASLARPGISEQEKARIQSSIKRKEKRENYLDDIIEKVDNAVLSVATEKARDMFVGAEQHRRNQETQVLNNQAALERHKETLKALFEPKNLVRTGAFLGLTTLGIATAIYLSKLGYRYAESHMNKPTLVRETSVHGIGRAIRDYISEFFTGSKPTPPSLSDIILSATHAVELNVLADDIKESYDCGLTLQNLLFYGPPGTGKTEFAKILATYSDLDYAIISGPDFAQFKEGEAVTEVHKLFAWLKNGKRPRIVFIDEADAVFRNRATLNKEGVEIVNAFLSHTGSNSDKFMFIFATNYENELDPAIRSRIHKKFKFDLPTADERFLILKLKLDKKIIRAVHTFERDGQEISLSLTIDNAADDAFLKGEAARMDGFSGRDIDQLVAEIAIRGYRSSNYTVTKDMISTIVSSKIEQVALDQKITAQQQAKLMMADAAVGA